MAKYNNNRKSNFLDSLPKESLDNPDNDLSSRCKFNFSYFTVDKAGQDFKDWSHGDLIKLFDKLKAHSKEPLKYWSQRNAGRYPVFTKYDSFPSNTDFTQPKHIPHQAVWCRFHLENKPRLIGFVVPDEYHDKAHEKTSYRFDKNTFYLVFLDKNHKFYKTK